MPGRSDPARYFPVYDLASMNGSAPPVKGNYPSGGRRFEKIVRFATVDGVKAGWLTKSKGHWIVTEEGRSALKKYKPQPVKEKS